MGPMTTNNSVRAAERAAKLAIQNVAYAENCSDEVRLRALARLAAVINGHMLEIDSRQPTPPAGVGEIYI
jgi:hypothetical protein